MAQRPSNAWFEAPCTGPENRHLGRVAFSSLDLLTFIAAKNSLTRNTLWNRIDGIWPDSISRTVLMRPTHPLSHSRHSYSFRTVRSLCGEKHADRRHTSQGPLQHVSGTSGNPYTRYTASGVLFQNSAGRCESIQCKYLPVESGSIRDLYTIN